MEDPFGLLEVRKSEPKPEQRTTFGKGAYLAVIAVLAVFVLGIGAMYLLQSKNSVSADVVSDSAATVKLENLPAQVKSGQEFSANLIISNRGQATISGAYVLVAGEGVNLNATIAASTSTTAGQPGFLRRLETDESSRFDGKPDTGFYLYIGELKANANKVQPVKATVVATSGSISQLEAKVFMPKTQKTNCGVFRSCSTTTGTSQLASGVFQINSAALDKIKLMAGYNFISLPYVFTSSAIKEFLGALKSKWAYIYQPTTAQYLDLNSADNAALIKPGAGFWVYDTEGGEYNLPESKAATNISETYTVPLSIGWNQIGNPYSKRMILDGAKIMVKELADDGSELGTSYTLKDAIDNGTLSKAYSVSRTAGSETLNTTEFPLGSTLSAYGGLLIQAQKKVNFILPGREIIATGDVISSEERSKIEKWITDNGLNQYGDPSGTVYSGGNPLFNEKTSQTMDRFDYILLKHSDRPWNS
jgi:hypothetical protein